MNLIKTNRDNYGSFNSLFDDFFNTELGDWRRQNHASNNSTLPKVNILEDENGFSVEMAAPGMEKKDFQIQLDHNLLTIYSEKKQEDSQEQAKYTRREFAYESFTRSFTLPESADWDKIAARYESGVLTVSIPKKEEAKPKPVKSISIK